MLRTVISGQSVMKAELLGEIGKTNGEIDKLRNELNEFRQENAQEHKKLTKRIDKLGFELAELSDDAPTRKEFVSLDKRVTRLETSRISS